MFSTAAKISRPERTSDGDGSSETFEVETWEVFCDPVVNENKTEIVLMAEEDVEVGDLIELNHSKNLR